MATPKRKKKSIDLSPSDIAEMLAEQFVNGNRAFVRKHLTKMLDENYVPIVTLRVYDMLYDPHDTYQASSFMRYVESFTY